MALNNSALASLEPLQIAAAAERCDAVGVAPSPRLARLQQLRALSPRALSAVRIRDALQCGDIATAVALTTEEKRTFFEECSDAGGTRARALVGTGATVCTYTKRALFDLTRSPLLARWVVDIMRGASPAQSQGERALRTLSHVADASILSSAAPSLGALRRRAQEPWSAVENELRLSLTTAGAALRPAPAATLALISGAMRAGAEGDQAGTMQGGQAQWLFAQIGDRPSAHDAAVSALLHQREAWAELGAELGTAFCDEVFVQLMVQLTAPPSVAAARRGWALCEALLKSKRFLPGQELENYVEWFLRSTKGRSADECTRTRRLVELLHAAQLEAAASAARASHLR